MHGYQNRDDQHLELLPDFETSLAGRMDIAAEGRALLDHAIFLERGWLIERVRTRKLRNEVEAERALRLDAEAALNEEQEAHGKIRVLAQLAAVKYKAETELRAAAVSKLRARVDGDEFRGSPHRESRGDGIAEALSVIEGATDA